ncbi:MAG: glycosyltransferase family 9 protein [bacterium]
MKSASALKRICLALCEKLLTTKERSPEEIEADQIERIIIIRRHDSLEDLLLATPVFRAVRQHYPNAYISVLTRTHMAPFIQNNVNLDEVICVDHGIRKWSLPRMVHLIKKLRRRYDLAIVLFTVSHSFSSDLLAYFTRAQFILGSEHLVFPGCKKNFFYNLLAPYSELNKHETVRNLDITRFIGIETEWLHEEIHLTREDKEKAIDYLNRAGLKPDDFILAINLDAWPKNDQDVALLVHLAKYFSSKYNARLVVSWELENEAAALEFVSSLPFRPIESNGLSLQQHLTLLYFCDLVFCYDNIIMHLAACVGTPLIAIFNESDPYHRKPIGSQFMAFKTEEGIGAAITSTQIIDMATRLCSQYPKRNRLKGENFDISDQVLDDYLNTLSTFEDSKTE